ITPQKAEPPRSQRETTIAQIPPTAFPPGRQPAPPTGPTAPRGPMGTTGPSGPSGPSGPEPPAPPRSRTETTMTRPPTAVHRIDQLVVTIGRAPENNVVLDDLLVSRSHALLRRSGDQWELVDNNSANGTYVNGNRINRAFIGPDDIVGIGHQLLHLADGRLVEYVDTGDVSYEASHLRVVTGDGKV